MKISKNKKYKTRSGLKVRIYATDGGGKQPVHGAIGYATIGWSSESWCVDGNYLFGRSSYEDLIEIKPSKVKK
jgi:hypothetical protein